MNLTTFAPLITYAVEQGKLLEILGDVGTLVGDVHTVGTSLTPDDVDALDKNGQITPTMTALASVWAMLSAMVKDPKHHADAVAIMKAVIGALA